MNLKQDVHDRLWRAFERWHGIRQTGVSKRDLKMQGIRECGDPNRFTRAIIFTGNTLRSYEGVLKSFVEFAQQDSKAIRLEDIGKKEFRAFMDAAIAKGLAVKTLNRYRSALAKFGALTGQTQSFSALSQKYGWKVRELAKTGHLSYPSRATPSREVLNRAIEVLRAWDARHFDRTGEIRAYHLAARVQLETSARSVSVTRRLGPQCIKENCQIELVGKGGKVMSFTLSPELHKTLALYFALHPGPMAGQRGYQSSFARAICAVGGQVTGTHGIRRRSARDFYAEEYRSAVGSGVDPKKAASLAAGNAVERLGHSRNRRDHRSWYLSR